MFRVLLALLVLAIAAPPHGWTEGTVAKGTSAVLTPLTPVPVEVPEPELARMIDKPTFIFYFSPNCPHCQETVGEIVGLHEKHPEMHFVGLATSRSTPEELEWFRTTFKVTFPLILGQPQGFATRIGARSTPTVAVVEPTEDGFQVIDHYGPWFEGASLIFEMRRDPDNAFSQFEPGHYQGDYACGTCHVEEAQSWNLTHHWIAYYTLEKQEKTDDAECVGCHVVGLGEPTGFELGDHGSVLTGVGCEACHSAGGPHDGERVDAADQCVRCHDADHSIDFSVAKGLPHIDHFRANTLTEQEQESIRRAIFQGEAPRPLLAFPLGDNVGPDACQDCHKAEVKAWKKSGHADAMGHLKGEDASNVACVSCHATPSASGPLPQELWGFDVDHGVACESCHGPGEEHVASPTASNIQGLGESCPECVLEAICTSCHDTEWDPSWDLHTRMDQAKGHK